MLAPGFDPLCPGCSTGQGTRLVPWTRSHSSDPPGTACSPPLEPGPFHYYTFLQEGCSQKSASKRSVVRRADEGWGGDGEGEGGIAGVSFWGEGDRQELEEVSSNLRGRVSPCRGQFPGGNTCQHHTSSGPPCYPHFPHTPWRKGIVTNGYHGYTPSYHGYLEKRSVTMVTNLVTMATRKSSVTMVTHLATMVTGYPLRYLPSLGAVGALIRALEALSCCVEPVWTGVLSGGIRLGQGY